jgi:hypothetical protein
MNAPIQVVDLSNDREDSSLDQPRMVLGQVGQQMLEVWFHEENILEVDSEPFLDAKQRVYDNLKYMISNPANQVLSEERIGDAHEEIREILWRGMHLCVSSRDLFAVLHEGLDMPESYFNTLCGDIYKKTQNLRRRLARSMVQTQILGEVIEPEEEELDLGMSFFANVRERFRYQAHRFYTHADNSYVEVMGMCWLFLAWLHLSVQTALPNLVDAQEYVEAVLNQQPYCLYHHHHGEVTDGMKEAFRELVIEPFYEEFIAHRALRTDPAVETNAGSSTGSNGEGQSSSPTNEANEVQANLWAQPDEGGWSFS